MKMTLVVALITLSSVAFAGDCTLTISRTACAGKEAEALKPYEGKNPTEEKDAAADEAACKTAGEKAAKIVRKGVLAKKEVKISFGGKAIGEAHNEKECK